MISIICVSNDLEAVEKYLKSSLHDTSGSYELIILDNTSGRFPSAAQALNYGAQIAHGDLLAFVHQDVVFIEKTFWADLLDIINKEQFTGVCGAFGVDEQGIGRGFIIDSWWLSGKPINKLYDVQTLDELLIIIPKATFAELTFNETDFNGWHLYGVDLCLRAKKAGIRVCAIPCPVAHFTRGTNSVALESYQSRVWQLHKGMYPVIQTTCGTLDWSHILKRIVKGSFKPLIKRWYTDDFIRSLGLKVMESRDSVSIVSVNDAFVVTMRLDVPIGHRCQQIIGCNAENMPVNINLRDHFNLVSLANPSSEVLQFLSDGMSVVRGVFAASSDKEFASLGYRPICRGNLLYPTKLYASHQAYSELVRLALI